MTQVAMLGSPCIPRSWRRLPTNGPQGIEALSEPPLMNRIKPTTTHEGLEEDPLPRQIFTWNLSTSRAFGATKPGVQLWETESEICLAISDSLWPHGLYISWNSPGQNTGVVGSLPLLQGIFPTQGSNPGLPRCRRILYSWARREAQEYFRE